MIDDVTRLTVLWQEIQVLESQIQPHDSGHLYTTIATLKHRCREIEGGLDEVDQVFIELKLPERDYA
jgi:hypothetical protein